MHSILGVDWEWRSGVSIGKEKWWGARGIDHVDAHARKWAPVSLYYISKLIFTTSCQCTEMYKASIVARPVAWPWLQWQEAMGRGRVRSGGRVGSQTRSGGWHEGQGWGLNGGKLTGWSGGGEREALQAQAWAQLVHLCGSCREFKSMKNYFGKFMSYQSHSSWW